MENDHKEKLEKLADIILEWNEKINVTAIRDRAEFMKKNVEDSLEVLKLPEFSDAKRILDLGTGGGFPGLPLAIACPDKEFYLLDSVAKKLKVVAIAADELGLENVDVLNMRAEDLAKWPAYRESFDIVVSRAVANMSTLSEYCLPFVKTGGYFVAYKTAAASEEIAAAENAVKLLGGGEQRIVSYGDEDSGHVFVIIKKAAACPKKYPRKAGLPSKQPLK
ncbi:MAG: 16S rRNA (guanine(527)-N(7))-methyltransferase RsmG [Firmicutes bacterium]|nr:16S rRNA (guanine(527)-N(7))-methyltransferase RsmG [Bacillota bacterium]MBR6236628.1 16S rRNA (guanine(527)-N(7))-methyltransferase RsmG [Bacillota bacterium]